MVDLFCRIIEDLIEQQLASYPILYLKQCSVFQPFLTWVNCNNDVSENIFKLWPPTDEYHEANNHNWFFRSFLVGEGITHFYMAVIIALTYLSFAYRAPAHDNNSFFFLCLRHGALLSNNSAGWCVAGDTSSTIQNNMSCNELHQIKEIIMCVCVSMCVWGSGGVNFREQDIWWLCISDIQLLIWWILFPLYKIAGFSFVS